jgi:hypothetical protein
MARPASRMEAGLAFGSVCVFSAGEKSCLLSPELGLMRSRSLILCGWMQDSDPPGVRKLFFEFR